MRHRLLRHTNHQWEELVNIRQVVGMGDSQIGAGQYPLALRIPEKLRGVVVQLDRCPRRGEDMAGKWKFVVVEVVASLQDYRQGVGSLRVGEGSTWNSWEWRKGS